MIAFFLIKATTFALQLFNFIIKPGDLWTVNRGYAFKRGVLVKTVSKRRIVTVRECVIPDIVYIKRRSGNIRRKSRDINIFKRAKGHLFG